MSKSYSVTRLKTVAFASFGDMSMKGMLHGIAFLITANILDAIPELNGASKLKLPNLGPPFELVFA